MVCIEFGAATVMVAVIGRVVIVAVGAGDDLIGGLSLAAAFTSSGGKDTDTFSCAVNDCVVDCNKIVCSWAPEAVGITTSPVPSTDSVESKSFKIANNTNNSLISDFEDCRPLCNLASTVSWKRTILL